ncbi:MAG: hypothetical protein ACREEP_06015 [Dongiaceae bacterium]
MFDRSRNKTLGKSAEDHAKERAASSRRASGFDAEPAPAAPSAGFGRRQTPLPETTNGAAPNSVANDRGNRAGPGSHRPLGWRGADAGRGHADAPPLAEDMPGKLVAWLSDELRSGRQVSYEAVLCALGALAGYSAQQAIRETVVKPGKLGLDEAFVVIETRSGEAYFFGDLLNAIIVAKDPKQLSIWKIVSDAGYEAGAINLPDVTDMIKHCAASVGGPEFGLPRLPEAHMPSILPREAVNRFWPTARRRLEGSGPMSWPLHFAMAAHKLIVEMKDTIRPDIAVRIVMEAAVPMSKIDPLTVPKE